MSLRLHPLALAAALIALASPAIGATSHFSNFTPLASSAGPIPVGGAGEATPLTLSSVQFSQRSIADRTAQLGAGQFNSGNWDMLTLNETGADRGRYLFTVFETGQAGIQRTDTWNGNATTTIWSSPAAAPALNSHVAFDASYWTPWGSFVTAEENWGAQPQPYGRLFELKNPLTATGNGNAQLVHANAVARVSHEGVQWDKAGNMYFIDELNGGSIYRYTPKASFASVLAGQADYFAGGTNAVLRVGTGAVDNAVGASSWVNFTDSNGLALAGAITINDPNGISAVDGRATTDLAAFKGTNYQRPEDLQMQTGPNGEERLYVATTTTNEVYVLDLGTGEMKVFANRNTIDLATGLAIGSALASPDNLAIDADGNIYIVEDRNGGVDNDVWFAKDLNKDGDLLDAGEGLARWVSNGTQGSEMTGLYFDPFNANRAWVNIQHPSSGNDRLIEITAVPEPSTYALMLGGLALVGRLAKRRSKR
ncbi:MAG: DUF839 domain-containing protein [Burkholderiales bacterium]|nr:DUF839 domain-containing protein [Burkholderiales bacterium]